MNDIPDRVRAWRELMHVHARVTHAIDEALREHLGITGAWYEALVEIAFASGEMQMNQFARETTLTKSGATRFVDRLEGAGLVERRSCPTDRRVLHLALTAQGRRVQKAADPHVLRVLQDHFGRHLSDDAARFLVETLAPMRKTPVPA